MVKPKSPEAATPAAAGLQSSAIGFAFGGSGRAKKACIASTGSGSNAMPSGAKFAANAARKPEDADIAANERSAATSDESAASSFDGTTLAHDAATSAAAALDDQRNHPMNFQMPSRPAATARASATAIISILPESRRGLPVSTPAMLTRLFFVAALTLAVPLAGAEATDGPAFPAAALATTQPPPGIAAASWFLLDARSGQAIVAQNADERREPASLTKLMTAYVAFSALRDKAITPSQMVQVSQTAWKAEGSRMFIEPRKAVSVDELLRGMIVQSGNDASVALAELIAGNETAFAERMNVEARRLKLTNTHFVNATGLSNPQHYSTAADMARLAAALIRDFPDYYPLYSMKEYRYNNITQPNRNRLLWIDPYADGVKTGHTEAAGWCLIGSAKRGERRLVAVVLGAASDASRASEAQKLLNYGFQSYDTIQLYPSGKPVSSLRVWKGGANDVAAGFDSDQYLTLPKGKAEKLQLTLAATEPLVAPVVKGQRIGVVKVVLEGKPAAEFPLVALADVAPANIAGRAWDTIRLWFR